jgi:hypothetical protein
MFSTIFKPSMYYWVAIGNSPRCQNSTIVTKFAATAPNMPLIPVPEVGLEPTHPCGHWILNPARLPIPPLWLMVPRPGSNRRDRTEPGIKIKKCTASSSVSTSPDLGPRSLFLPRFVHGRRSPEGHRLVPGTVSPHLGPHYLHLAAFSPSHQAENSRRAFSVVRLAISANVIPCTSAKQRSVCATIAG